METVERARRPTWTQVEQALDVVMQQFQAETIGKCFSEHIIHVLVEVAKLIPHTPDRFLKHRVADCGTSFASSHRQHLAKAMPQERVSERAVEQIIVAPGDCIPTAHSGADCRCVRSSRHQCNR